MLVEALLGPTGPDSGKKCEGIEKSVVYQHNTFNERELTMFFVSPRLSRLSDLIEQKRAEHLKETQRANDEIEQQFKARGKKMDMELEAQEQEVSMREI